MQLLNSKILSNDKITRYSNKKAQDTQYLVLFVCCSFFVQQRWWRWRDLHSRPYIIKAVLLHAQFMLIGRFGSYTNKPTEVYSLSPVFGARKAELVFPRV